MGNVVAGCYIVCRKGETIMNGNGDITLNGYAIIPLEQYSGVMPNDAVPPVTDEQWMHWQKLVSDEHGRQEAEAERLRIALGVVRDVIDGDPVAVSSTLVGHINYSTLVSYINSVLEGA